jgi:Protein of unknown function (DUF1800)
METMGNMTGTQRSLHALNRLGFGPRPGDIDSVQRVGVDRYIAQQLSPESMPEPDDLTRRIDALRTLRMTPVELFLEFSNPCGRRPRATRGRARRHGARRAR